MAVCPPPSSVLFLCPSGHSIVRFAMKRSASLICRLIFEKSFHCSVQGCQGPHAKHHKTLTALSSARFNDGWVTTVKARQFNSAVADSDSDYDVPEQDFLVRSHIKFESKLKKKIPKRLDQRPKHSEREFKKAVQKFGDEGDRDEEGGEGDYVREMEDYVRDGESKGSGENEEGEGFEGGLSPGESVVLDPNAPRLLIEDSEHPIRHKDIANAAWTVINRLRQEGYEVFLVGGTVRDLLLRKRPKDIDIVTSAELKEVRRLFHRSKVIGKRFPICLVRVGTTPVEISSMSTGIEKVLPADANEHMSSEKNRLKQLMVEASGPPLTWSDARMLDAMRRDFTVNALLYEPCTRIIFDYVGGVADLGSNILRCIKDPVESFKEDPARILRAVRFASRAGLQIQEKTANAMEKLAKTTIHIPESRAQLELDSLFSYGSSARAFELLWKHKILDVFFPKIAKWMESEAEERGGNLESNVLFRALKSLDRHYNAQRPANPGLWGVILAMPIIEVHCRTLRVKLEAVREQHRRKTGKKVEPYYGKKPVRAKVKREITDDVVDELDMKKSDPQGSDSDGDSEEYYSEDQNKIKRLLKQTEDVIFESLVVGTLNTVAQSKKRYYVLSTKAIEKARRTLVYLKQCHLLERDGQGGPSTRPKLEDTQLMAVLGRKELNWAERSDLGLYPLNRFVDW